MNLCEGNRIIYKQGYLKKAPKAGKFAASFKKWDKRWFVFGTMTGSVFLEYYETEAGPGKAPPINTIWLGTCQFVTVNVMEQKYDNTFTIGMMDRVLNLVAPTLGEMHAWIECLQSNLTKLGILHGKDNLYDEHPKRSQCFTKQQSIDKQQCGARAGDKPGLEVHLPTTDDFTAMKSMEKSKFQFDETENVGGQNVDGGQGEVERGREGVEGDQEGIEGGIGVLEYEPDDEGGKRPLQVMVEFDIDESGKKIPIRDPRSPLPPTPLDLHPRTPLPLNPLEFTTPSIGNHTQLRSPLSAPPSGNMMNENLIDFDEYESPFTPPSERAPAIPPPAAPPGGDIEGDTYGAVWHRTNGNSTTQSDPHQLRRNNSRPIKLINNPPPVPANRRTRGSVDSPRSPDPFFPLPGYRKPSLGSPRSPDPLSLPSNSLPAYRKPSLGSPRSPDPFQSDLENPGYDTYKLVPSSGLPVDPSCDPLPAASTFDPEAMKNVMATAIGANKNLTHDAILEFAKSKSNEMTSDNRGSSSSAGMQRQNSRGALTEKMGSMTLKEREVYQLKQEISHPGGVRVSLRKKDCHHTLALIEILDAVWIAGWNQKARPFLHSAFHIGDQIVSVNGFQVTRSKDIPRVLDSSRDDVKVEFIVKRTPHAKVFAIKRSAEGEHLGFKREGGTAEIGFVNLAGLAAKHGLSAKAQTIDGSDLCNWVITEINNRPLNLFFKDNEIEYRLNAVGRDISLMVQPKDFIKLLKKQLKQLKGYKDFIVQ
ncbi:uncharacterized protein LOC141900511 [Tubulanus polymorphus]|uniref:uncharacterized protein LOC141900511 n=1 Tax=Tubulanus polymorphus TaxID=672921 RepID=UPI003DA1DCDC